MPTRPAIHRPAGAEFARIGRAQRDRERAATRPGAALRGYDAEWRVARKAHLLANPLCVVCGAPATDVDHIVSVADDESRRLDPTNFRSMCHAHHAQRTARDQGFAQSGPANSVHAPQRAQRHPPWLGSMLVPTTIVCGPPGSGRATLVAERASPRDLVLDLHAIAARLANLPLFHAPASFLDPAMRWRNSHLKLAAMRRNAWPAVWLILGEPKAEWRAWWRDTIRPARIVVMETTAETCIDRLYADERRPPAVRRVHAEYVTQWWADYTRLATDIVLRDGQRPTTGAALGA